MYVDLNHEMFISCCAQYERQPDFIRYQKKNRKCYSCSYYGNVKLNEKSNFHLPLDLICKLMKKLLK